MISFFELLKLVKKGKQPEYVVYNNAIYKWIDKDYGYVNGRGTLSREFFISEMFEKNIISEFEDE